MQPPRPGRPAWNPRAAWEGRVRNSVYFLKRSLSFITCGQAGVQLCTLPRNACIMWVQPQKHCTAAGARSQGSGAHWLSRWRGSEARACLCDLDTSLPPRPLSTAGTLAQPFTSSEPQDTASHPQDAASPPQTRGPPVPRRATEPSTPRSRAQRRPSGRDSPLQQRAPSFRLERALVAEMGEWMHPGWPEPGSGPDGPDWKIKPTTTTTKNTCITL